MHAYLIISKSVSSKDLAIKNLASKNKAKILSFTLQKIEDSRDLKKIIKFSFSETFAIVIKDIDDATSEAGNSFLKNLEEPNNNITYILTAKNLDNVLPTIVSRCEVIYVKDTKHEIKNATEIEKFLRGNINNKFLILGKIKEREEAVSFVENLIYMEKEMNNFSNMENYLQTISNLKNNGNVALQLTNLVAKMTSDEK